MYSFLETLYFLKFEILERQKRLMNNHDWKNDESGKMDNVRNDQSITEVQNQVKMINELIDKYIRSQTS